MLSLKTASDLIWSDLPYIERPDQAQITLHQNQRMMGSPVIGMDRYSGFNGNTLLDSQNRLFNDLQNGQVFLVNRDTVAPAVEQLTFANDKISFKVSDFVKNNLAFNNLLQYAIQHTLPPQAWAPARQDIAEQQGEKQEKQKKEIKKHMIQLEVEAEKGSSLPEKKYITLVVQNDSQSSIPVKQVNNVVWDTDSRIFKAQDGDNFKVFAITDRMKSVKDDLRKNGNLDASESDSKISPLEITGSESRPDDVVVHYAKYVVPNKYVEIELLDEDDAPEVGVRYQVLDLDGNLYQKGELDENGYARVEGIEESEVEILFPEFDQSFVEVS